MQNDEQRDYGKTRVALILRMIMSTGTGIIFFNVARGIICPIQDPINLNLCIRLTGEIMDILVKAGIFPVVSATIGGFTVWWASGNWSKN